LRLILTLSVKSTHSTPQSEVRGMLRVDTERRFLHRFKNRGLAPSNVSNTGQDSLVAFGRHDQTKFDPQS
jgi:hypothetical protein